MSDRRCCICLDDLGSQPVAPRCCESGWMHEHCARHYVRWNRISSVFPRCPACRRNFGVRNLVRLIPPRRVFSCEGTFYPLQESSKMQVSLIEDHGVMRTRMSFDFGRVDNMPLAPRLRRPQIEGYQKTVPWALDPVAEYLSGNPEVDLEPDNVEAYGTKVVHSFQHLVETAERYEPYRLRSRAVRYQRVRENLRRAADHLRQATDELVALYS